MQPLLLNTFLLVSKSFFLPPHHALRQQYTSTFLRVPFLFVCNDTSKNYYLNNPAIIIPSFPHDPKRYHIARTTRMSSQLSTSSASNHQYDGNKEEQQQSSESTSYNHDDDDNNNNSDQLDDIKSSSYLSKTTTTTTTHKVTKKNHPFTTKTHCCTLCIVPPSSSASSTKDEEEHIWSTLQNTRTYLRDPGLYRWPPHINVLYPFYDLQLSSSSSSTNIQQQQQQVLLLEEQQNQNAQSLTINKDENDSSHSSNNKEIMEIIHKLHTAIQPIQPFRLSLQTFKVFGGKHRGVLYLDPKCIIKDQKHPSNQDNDNETAKNTTSTTTNDEDPLQSLQNSLLQHFPECNDQLKNGKYTPHMTLSHFVSSDDAMDKIKELEGMESIRREIVENNDLKEYQEYHPSTNNPWCGSIEFDVNEIYLLKRINDDGQFQRLYTFHLGGDEETHNDGIPFFSSTSNSSIVDDESNGYNKYNGIKNVQYHDPPLRFPFMPTQEENWVYEERMKMKQRRRIGNSRRRRERTRMPQDSDDQN